MASAAEPSLGGLASGNEGLRSLLRRGTRRTDHAAPPNPDWTPAEMAISVPEVRGHLRLPRPARLEREWATSRTRYRVRAGRHIAHISDNLMDLLLLVDGRHTVAEIAQELERQQHRPVHPSEVAYLLRERLAAAGLVRLRRGMASTGVPRIPAYAAPCAPLAAEAPTLISMSGAAGVTNGANLSGVESLAEPRALAAATVQAPAPMAEPQAPAALVTEDPPAGVVPDVAPLAIAIPTPIATPVPVPEPAPPPPDASDDDETLDLAELRPALASPPTPDRASDTPIADDTAQDERDAHAAAGMLAARDDEPAAPAGADAPADDAPTLVIPREALPHRMAALNLTPLPPDSLLIPAALEGAAPRVPPAPRTFTAPAPAVARRRLPTRVVLALVALALLALLAATALHSGLIGGTFALRPTPTLAPTATPTPPQERILPGETAYSVRPGDTLSSVAARAHISADALALVNADVLGSSGALVSGMRLAIPAIYQPGVPAARQPRPLYYALRRGDTLYQVGQLFGLNWHTIATYNHITNQYSMSVGQGIIIPAQP